MEAVLQCILVEVVVKAVKILEIGIVQLGLYRILPVKSQEYHSNMSSSSILAVPLPKFIVGDALFETSKSIRIFYRCSSCDSEIPAPVNRNPPEVQHGSPEA